MKYLKKFAMLLAWVSMPIYAEIYVLDTLGGASLQPIIQQQLNQLPNGGSVSVYQQRLIINTTPQNYQTIAKLVRQIDQLPKNLTVSVRVANREMGEQQNGYANIGVIHKQIFVNGQWQNQQHHTSGQQFFQIKTQSGKPASLSLSQLLPVSQIRQSYGYRPQIWLGQTLLNAEQGINVTPTLLANGQISLQIAQTNQKFNQFHGQTAVNGQNLSNTLIISPNQWTTIGFISHAQTHSGMAGYQQSSEQLPIEVMVNES